MSLRTPSLPTLAAPKLLDKALLPIQAQLLTSMTWLNHAFGKAVRQIEVNEQGRYIYPAVYVGEKDYLPVFPDEHIGNFSFFDVARRERRKKEIASYNEFEAEIGLILWWHYPTVYLDPLDWSQYTVEDIKVQVLTAIDSVLSTDVRVEVVGFRERGEEIYDGYTDQEIPDQYLMRPFGGLRADLEIIYNDLVFCP